MKTLVPLLTLAVPLLGACGDKAEDTAASDTGEEQEQDSCTAYVTLVTPQEGTEYDQGSTVTLFATAAGSEACGGAVPVVTWVVELAPTEVEFEENGSPDAVNSSFVAEVQGAYALSVEACVDDVCAEDGPVNFEVVSANNPPVADIDADNSGKVGQSISLDGTGSSDADGQTLTYEWTFYARPSTSNLEDSDIQGGSTAAAAFTPDVAGGWAVQLEVSDGEDRDTAIANIIVE